MVLCNNVERINKVPAVAGRKPVLNFLYVKTTLIHIIMKGIGLFGNINIVLEIKNSYIFRSCFLFFKILE